MFVGKLQENESLVSSISLKTWNCSWNAFVQLPGLGPGECTSDHSSYLATVIYSYASAKTHVVAIYGLSLWLGHFAHVTLNSQSVN